MPGYTKTELRTIYDRTGGYCHLCKKKLAFTNYGSHGDKGAWEIDHSVPQANGGTDHGNNLVAACTGCNRSKQAMTTRAVRARNGFTTRPESRGQRRETEELWAGVKTLGVLGAAALVLWKLFGKKDPPPSGDPSF